MVKKFSLFTMMIIGILGTLGQVTSDLYLPSLPMITTDLNSHRATIQLTLSFFMLGFGVSSLVYGPISDKIGRKKVILAGVLINIFGTIICVLASSASILIAGRLIQGLGTGVGNSVGRTLLRDVYSGEQLARLGSYIGMMAAVLMACAPTLGGYIQHYLFWRANFIFLLLYSSLLLIAIMLYLPETHMQLNPHAIKPKILCTNIKLLIYDKKFMGYTLCAAIAYAGLIAYLTVAPFLFQKVVGLGSVQFGWLAFLIAGSLFISGFLNGQFVGKKGIHNMMVIGTYIMIAGAILMLVFAALGWINTFVIIFPIMIFSIGCGFNFSNAYAGAFGNFAHIAGTATSLFACLQILGGSAASAIMALLHINTQIPLGIMLLALGILALLSLTFLAKPE